MNPSLRLLLLLLLLLKSLSAPLSLLDPSGDSTAAMDIAAAAEVLRRAVTSNAVSSGVRSLQLAHEPLRRGVLQAGKAWLS